jgi:hypothetical protein
MKIFEIISEQQTQEGIAADILGGIGSLGFKAAKAFHGDEPLIKKGAQELADLAKANNTTVKDAAVQMAKNDKAAIDHYATKYNVSPEEAAKALGKRPDLADEVLAQAKTDSGLRVFGLGKFVGLGKLEIIKEAGKTLAGLGLDAAYLYELWQPALDYYNHMSDAEEWVKSGKIPPKYEQFKDVEEWYNAYRQREMQILIGREVANFAVAKLAKIPGKLLGKLIGKFGSKELAPALETLGGTLTGTVGLTMFNSSDVAKDIAEAMAGNFFGIQGFAGAKAVQALDALTPDFMKSVKRGPVSNATPASGTPATTTDSNPTATPNGGQGATPTATPTATPAAGAQPELLSGFKLAPNASPLAQWKDIGSGWKQDPKTGQRALDAQLH